MEKPISFRAIVVGVILFGLFLLCVIWGGVYLKLEDERTIAINNAVRETGNFARSFEEHTLRTIKSVDQTVLFLKYEYEKSNEWIGIPGYIKEGRLTDQPFVLLGIIDARGELRVSSQEPFVPSSLKDREHFKVHLNSDSDKLFISKPVLGRSSGKWSIQMTRRINKADGSFGGVVVVSVDPFYFTEFYKRLDLGPDSSIALVGTDGIIRARRSGDNAEIGQDLNGAPLMEALKEKSEGHYISNSAVDGTKRVYSYRTLQDYPLVVSVGVSEAAVFADLNKRSQSYYLAASGSSLIIILFIMPLLRGLWQQKKDRDALQQARDGLEVQVDIRTQELFSLNHVLQRSNDALQGEVAERKRAETKLEQKRAEIEAAYAELKNMQSQIVQQEKMASIGQLAAGVAHEINNPMGYIISNLGMLQSYTEKLNAFLAVQDEFKAALLQLPKEHVQCQQCQERIAALTAELEQARTRLEIDYLLADTQDLLKETLDGADRVKKIVQDLKSFARFDDVRKISNVNEGIESTVNIIWNELKYKAAVEKDLGVIPDINCNLGQLNQVFMNLLLNAVQAIEGSGRIAIRSWQEGKFIFISVSDTGKGIEPEAINRIFEPFYTTKEIGEGTGLGLSVSYDIVKKHGGEISVASELGQGTTFTIKLPISDLNG
ncbi:ATP-binding protein [Azotosporobacter soli]|uniref:ATP-binding protein n=1 Tax=Azotosporobacter soli TaxID=3055040 RepID=UPI0031FE9762